MANEVKLTIKVGDDGTLDVVAKKAEKAAKSTEKLTKSTQQTTKARNRYHKGEKGVAQAGMNTTKSFSKMRDTMSGSSGLVGAYATLAANVFALTAAFGVLSRAAEVSTLEQGFTRLGNIVGRTSTLMANSLIQITDNAISLDQAFRTAASGFSAGFSTDAMNRLATIAKQASIALGRDLSDSLDRLIRGVAKLEPEILDELGIFVRLDDAVSKYAVELGKTAGSLTQTERRQAFLNEALAQGEQKFASIGEEVPVNPFNQLAAAFQNLAQTVLESINVVILPLINLLSSSSLALIGTLTVFSSTILKQMVPALGALGFAAKKAAQKQKEAAAEGEKDAQRMIKTARMLAGKTSPLGTKTVFAGLQDDLQKGNYDVKKLDDALASLNRSENRRVNDLAKGKVDNIKLAEKELQIVRDQKKAVEQLISAEKGQLGPQKAAKRAQGAANVETRLGKSTEEISSLGAIEGFKKAQVEMTRYSKRTAAIMHREGEYKKGHKGLQNLLKNSPYFFRLAAGGARLFGAALINAIPLIGQIIFVLGLVAEQIISYVSSLDLASESQKKFDAITESLPDKLEQLADTNSNLENKYYALALSSELAGKAGKLSAQEFGEAFKVASATAEELAKTNTAIASYGNNLKVAAGVMDEFGAAVGELGKEVGEADIGALDVFLDQLTTSLTKVSEAFKTGVIENFKAVIEFFKDLSSTITEFISGAWQKFSNAFPEMAEAISGVGKAVKTVVENSPPALIVKGVVAGVEAGVKGYNDLKEGINNYTESGEDLVRFNRYLEGVTESYEGLLKQGKDNPEFLSFIEKLNTELGPGGLESAMRAVFEETGEFAAAQLFTEGIIKKVTDALNKQNNAVNNYQEGLKEAATKLTEFTSKHDAKDEFGALADEVLKAQGSIQGLKDNLKEGISLADVLEKDRTVLEPMLKSFGLSVEDVKAKGVGAFTPLLEDMKAASDLSKTLKDKLNELKSSLKDLKLEYNTTVAREELRLLKKSIEETGKAGQAVQFAGVDLNEDNKVESRLKEEYELRKKLNQDEANLKKQLIEQEVALRKKILEIQLKMSGLDGEKAQEVRDLIESLDDNVTAQKGVVDAEKDLKDIQNVNKFLNDQLTLRRQILSSVKDESKTIFERAKLFGSTDFAVRDEDGNELNKFDTARNALEAFRGLLSGTLNELKALGPEGEVVAQIASSTMLIGDAFLNMGESFSNAETKLEKFGAVAAAVGATIGAINSIIQANANAQVQAIDKSIEAEKKRDGKTGASLSKIKQFEKKKESIQRKAFETNKKMLMAQTVANTAAGMIGVFAGLRSHFEIPIALAGAALIGALGAAQLAIIAGQQFQGGGGSSAPSTPSGIAIGDRRKSVDLARSQGAAGELAYMRGESGAGGPENFRRGFAGLKYRAEGGNTGIVVGEQGPELFVPSTPGRVVPNDDIGASNQNINFSINAVDAAGVEELLVNQRGNIIGMLREASNSYGQPFMEKVNTQVYSSQGGVSRYGDI